MRSEIQKLHRDLELPRPEGYEPFDRYAYNALSWQAAYWAIHARAQEERDEASRLRDVAVAKSKAMLETERLSRLLS